MAASAAAWLIEHEPTLKHTLQHAMGNYYRHMLQNLPDDGEFLPLYWTQTDLDTGKCYPLVKPRISKDRKDYLIDFDWNFYAYASKIRWGDNLATLTDTALLAHHYALGFSPGELSLCNRMLNKLDDQRLLWMIDPDGRQLMAEDAFVGKVLSSETPSFTLLTYWRAKNWGIALHADSRADSSKDKEARHA